MTLLLPERKHNRFQEWLAGNTNASALLELPYTFGERVPDLVVLATV
jgi:hypothetical protein